MPIFNHPQNEWRVCLCSKTHIFLRPQISGRCTCMKAEESKHFSFGYTKSQAIGQNFLILPLLFMLTILPKQISIIKTHSNSQRHLYYLQNQREEFSPHQREDPSPTQSESPSITDTNDEYNKNTSSLPNNVHRGWNSLHKYNTCFNQQRVAQLAIYNDYYTFTHYLIQAFLSTNDHLPAYSRNISESIYHDSFTASTKDTLHHGNLKYDPDRHHFEEVMKRKKIRSHLQWHFGNHTSLSNLIR
jgi:hypothetical protein